MNIKTYSNEKNALISLFIVELMALTVFNLGNLAWGYRIIAFVLATICAIPLSGFLKEKNAYKTLLSLGLVYLFSIMSAAFGLIGQAADSLTKISLILGVGAFFIIGLFVGCFSDEKHVKTSYVVSAFYIGLSLFVGISLIVTIYHLGTPFYHIIYADEPALHEVIQKAYIIIGFDSEKVSIKVLANYALILSTGSLGIFLISNDKKNKTFKMITCLSGLLGIITILFLTCSLHIYLFLSLACVVYVLKTWNTNKKQSRIVALIGIVCFVILLGINGAHRVNLLGIQSAINSSKFARKILLVATDFDERVNNIKVVFSSISVFGHSSDLAEFKDIKTGNLLFDVMYNSGIIAFLCLSVFVLLQFFEGIKFYKNHSKNVVNQFILIIMSVIFGVIIFNSYIISTTLDFVLHGALMLLGIMCAQNAKVKKRVKMNASAMSNEA